MEKRKITRKRLFRFFFSCFYAHSLIFSVSGPFGLFPFLVPFWMEHVDSFIFANSSFCALDGCSWRFLHLLDNSLFLFRIIKRVSATMMETFEKPTASFFFLSVSSIRRVAETTWLSCLTFDLFPRANRKCESAEWNWRGRSWLVFFSSSINSQMGSSLIFFLYSILIERNGPRKRVGKKELAATFLQVDIYLFIYIKQ